MLYYQLQDHFYYMIIIFNQQTPDKISVFKTEKSFLSIYIFLYYHLFYE